MKESVTQELDYGCAIACIAFAMGVPYQDAAVLVGKKQANSSRFYAKDLLVKKPQTYICRGFNCAYKKIEEISYGPLSY